MLDKFYLQKEVKKMTSLFFPVTDVAKYRKHLRDMTIDTLKRLLVLFWGWGWGCFFLKILHLFLANICLLRPPSHIPLLKLPTGC